MLVKQMKLQALLSNPKLFWLLLPLFLLLTWQFTFSNLKVLQKPALDFTVLYQAGKQVSVGLNPYSKKEISDFHTPPPSLLVFSLLPLLPLEMSQIAWFLLSLISFLIGSYFLFKALNISDNRLLWIFYLSGVLVFFPFRFNLGSGEVNNFLFFFLSTSFYLLQKKKELPAAFLLSLGIIFKITPLFFLFLFLLEKRIKILLGIAVCLLTLGAVTLLVFGPDLFLHYWAVIPRYFNLYDPVYYNQSLTAVFLRFSLPLTSIRIFSTLLLSFALLVFIYFQRKINSQDLTSQIILWNIGILYTLIFSTFAWQHHFTIVLFPLITTTYLFYKTKLSPIFFLTIAIIYLMLGLNIKNPAGLANFNITGAIILSHVFLGGVFLLLLNYFLAWRIKY
ncbi:MAG: glycosyltransferase family 87 protein [bacterium]|nr:glycosyltransferase family 87 protein [bacterium]